MKTLVIAASLAISAFAWGAEWQRDGSLLLSREEVNYVRTNYESMRQTLEIVQMKLQELAAENEALKTGKCI